MIDGAVGSIVPWCLGVVKPAERTRASLQQSIFRVNFVRPGPLPPRTRLACSHGQSLNHAVTDHHRVFVTGATGYVGKALIPALLARGHDVRALVRPGRAGSLPAGVETVTGNALRAETFAASIPPADTIVHLVGTPRPSPAKAAQFQEVDLPSIKATVSAAQTAGIRHLVYVSVAHPAPIMQAYIAVRQLGEHLVRASGLSATIVQPWYVLGPGHRWPMLLTPMYVLLELIPATRPGARRLGLVTLAQMVRALVGAVEHPPTGIRILDVPAIKRRVQDEEQ